jgi:hypothetical protein
MPVRELINRYLPVNVSGKTRKLKSEFLEKYIKSLYSNESILQRRFFNIGAGSQRSIYDFWTYVDLEASKYSKEGIDVFYDLESLTPMPISDNYAEVIFSSFVIEHISIAATKNLCEEAYRSLKKGGVFHSKVHCFDYAYMLYRNNLISPKIPFECRESRHVLNSFVKKHKGRVEASFNDKHEYVVKSLSDGSEIVFNAANSFVYHNATAAFDNLMGATGSLNNVLMKEDAGSAKSFYNNILGYVDDGKREPHQHNANYFSKEELFLFIKELGFSEVYFTQPFQSVSPALWEEKLNPIHKGFLFSIEAIK